MRRNAERARVPHATGWFPLVVRVAPAWVGATMCASAALPGGLVAWPRVGLFLWVAATAGWVLAVVGGRTPVGRRGALALLALPLVGLTAQPSLSDDIYRYVHEGRASRIDLSWPYEVPPAAFTPPPDDGISARVNHPEVPAVYPPFSQLLFAALAFLGDAIGHPLVPFRILFALCHLVVIYVLYRRQRGCPRALLAFALHPLPFLEGVIGAHVDIVGVALVTLCLQVRTATLRRGVALGLACGVKPLAVLATLGVMRRGSRALLVAGLAGGALIPLAPYVAKGTDLTRGLVEYGTRWQAQPTGYALVHGLIAPAMDRYESSTGFTHLHVTSTPPGVLVETAGHPRLLLGAGTPATRPILVDAHLLARLVCGAVFVACAIVLFRRCRDPMKRVTYVLLVFFLLSPTLHPWYLLWLMPTAALSSSWAVLAFAAASPLCYEAAIGAHAGGLWTESAWPRIAMFASAAVGAVVEFRAWRSAGAVTTPR